MSVGSEKSIPSVVIPDLHGCSYFLDWVLEAFPNRHYIFLGDLIHRGSEARYCLQTALQLSEKGQAVLLWGNHEFWVCDEGLKKQDLACEEWFLREEADLIQQYLRAGQGLADCLNDFERFATQARHFYVEGDMLCAHASRPSFGATPQDILDQGYLWDRPSMGLHPLPIHFFPNLTYSVHGHTIVPNPVVDLENQGVVYLDLGSGQYDRFCVWDAYKRTVKACPLSRE